MIFMHRTMNRWFHVLLILAVTLATTLTYADAKRSIQLNEEAVKYTAQGKIDKAIELLQRSLSVDPNNLTSVHNLAVLYLEAGKTGKAKELLTRYLKTNPQSGDLLATMGDLYFATKDSKSARSFYTEAIKAQTSKNIYRKLASVCLLEKDVTCAKRSLERSIILDPKDFESYLSLANLHLVDKEFQQAIKHAQTALQLKLDIEPYLVLTQGYLALNDKKKARTYYDNLLKLKSQLEGSQKLDRQTVANIRVLAREFK